MWEDKRGEQKGEIYQNTLYACRKMPLSRPIIMYNWYMLIKILIVIFIKDNYKSAWTKKKEVF